MRFNEPTTPNELQLAQVDQDRAIRHFDILQWVTGEGGPNHKITRAELEAEGFTVVKK